MSSAPLPFKARKALDFFPPPHHRDGSVHRAPDHGRQAMQILRVFRVRVLYNVVPFLGSVLASFRSCFSYSHSCSFSRLKLMSCCSRLRCCCSMFFLVSIAQHGYLLAACPTNVVGEAPMASLTTRCAGDSSGQRETLLLIAASREEPLFCRQEHGRGLCRGI